MIIEIVSIVSSYWYCILRHEMHFKRKIRKSTCLASLLHDVIRYDEHNDMVRKFCYQVYNLNSIYSTNCTKDFCKYIISSN